MADIRSDVEFNVKAKTKQARDELGKVRDSTEKLGEEAAKTEKKFAESLDKLATGFAKFGLAVNGVNTAMQGMRKAGELVRFAGEVNDLEKQFGDLAVTVQDSTGGTVDRMSIMRSASKALRGEFALTEERFQTVWQAADELSHRGFGDTIQLAELLFEKLRSGETTELRKFNLAITGTGTRTEKTNELFQALQDTIADPAPYDEARQQFDELETVIADTANTLQAAFGTAIGWVLKKTQEAAIGMAMIWTGLQEMQEDPVLAADPARTLRAGNLAANIKGRLAGQSVEAFVGATPLELGLRDFVVPGPSELQGVMRFDVAELLAPFTVAQITRMAVTMDTAGIEPETREQRNALNIINANRDVILNKLLPSMFQSQGVLENPRVVAKQKEDEEKRKKKQKGKGPKFARDTGTIFDADVDFLGPIDPEADTDTITGGTFADVEDFEGSMLDATKQIQDLNKEIREEEIARRRANDAWISFSSILDGIVMSAIDAFIEGEGNMGQAILGSIKGVMRAESLRYGAKALAAVGEAFFTKDPSLLIAAAKYSAASAAFAVGARVVGGFVDAGPSAQETSAPGGGAGRFPTGGRGGGGEGTTVVVNIGQGFVGDEVKLGAEISRALDKAQNAGAIRQRLAASFGG